MYAPLIFGRRRLHIFAFVASNLILIKQASVTERQIGYSMPSHFMDRKLVFVYPSECFWF